MSPSYPVGPTSPVSDDHHGETVADPFRPLEDPADPATRAWVDEQNRLTEALLSSTAGRADIRARIAELWDHPKAGVPFERGGRWFQMRNTGLQPQAVLYVSDDLSDGGRVLVDPNELSADGTVSLTGFDVSEDGRLLAWATSSGGSDWMSWRVRDIDRGEDLTDVIEWSKFSGAAWAGPGFYYGAADRPQQGGELTAVTDTIRIRHHIVGTSPSADATVFEAPGDPDQIPTAAVTDDGRWLVITLERGTAPETSILVGDLTRPGTALTQLNRPFVGRDVVIDSFDGDFFVFTDRGAERGRVLRGRSGVDPDDWDEVIAEAGWTLLDAHLFGGHLVCHYLRDARSEVRVHRLDGSFVRAFTLPGPVSVTGLSGRAGSPLVHYQVTSYLQSGSLWSHDLRTGETTEVSPAAAALDDTRYLTEQVFVASGDGTRVPVFLTRRRDLVADQTNPVLLYGYGGFGIPLTPSFSVTFAAWAERGGIVAVANLRGGGEYGREWHDAGRLARKQNVFDDFAACARWLASSGWSQPGRTAIMGGSNGGLLVGASITQHPELFGAAVAEVGVFDMLRFHLFTIGWAWKSDYGDPEDAEHYRWLRAYSPLHNLRPGTCYPPTLLMTGDHDDRVVPAHSYKFAAALQLAQSCDRPVLLRVATSAGHGAGKPTAKLIDEAADRLTFIEWALLGR